jgi:branched-chain amino acid transport system ATP-binding protein
MALLEVEDLEVFYGKSQVIHGVSFAVDRGELVSIVGPNGAGKTSLLDSLVNHTDWTGEIRFDGTSVADCTPYEVADLGLSYCMEEDNVFPYMTVRQNLLSGAHRKRDAVQDRLEMVHDLFPILEERADQRANTLSGGQRQMLAIGVSLMGDPEMLVLDEPTLGLAPVIIDDIADAIDRLREEDLAVLLVEQNVTFGFEHADRVILMDTGEFAASGPPEELEDDEYVSETFLGMPSAEAD